MQFIHHTGKKKKVYEITTGGLSVTSVAKNGLSSNEIFSFENIRTEKFFYEQKLPGFLIAGAIMLLIYGMILADSLKANNDKYIYTMVWGLGGLASIILFFTYRPKIYFIKTHAGNYIKFPASKQLEELNNFVTELYKQRAIYLKARFGKPNPHLTYDAQFSNFGILQKEGVLSMEEYQENIETLNRMFNQTKPQQTYFRYSEN